VFLAVLFAIVGAFIGVFTLVFAGAWFVEGVALVLDSGGLTLELGGLIFWKSLKVTGALGVATVGAGVPFFLAWFCVQMAEDYAKNSGHESGE
jgi:hypothetical protein